MQCHIHLYVRRQINRYGSGLSAREATIVRLCVGALIVAARKAGLACGMLDARFVRIAELAEQDHLGQAFLLDRPNPALGKGV
jgi:hypothetical protein